MKLVPLTSASNPDWRRLRKALWPGGADSEHEAEMAEFVAAPDRIGWFMTCNDKGTPVNLAEATRRLDCVDGTETSPEAFPEGLYAQTRLRSQGVARACLVAVRTGVASRASTDLASDSQIEQPLSQSAHLPLGFTETECVVDFNMALERKAAA